MAVPPGKAEHNPMQGRPLRLAARSLVREVTDRRAYRNLAARVRYPVAAMLISQTVLTFGATAVLARFSARRGSVSTRWC